MATVAYLGSAPEAAGFRLAGALTPATGTVADAFELALAQAAVVIVAAEVAAEIPAARLEAALARSAPLVVIAPQRGEPPHPLDPAERVRRQLGLET